MQVFFWLLTVFSDRSSDLKKIPSVKIILNLALSNAQIYFLERVKISTFLIGLHLLNKILHYMFSRDGTVHGKEPNRTVLHTRFGTR